MQAKMTMVEVPLTDLKASGRTCRRLELSTWASDSPGRSRVLKGVMFCWTFESPITVNKFEPDIFFWLWTKSAWKGSRKPESDTAKMKNKTKVCGLAPASRWGSDYEGTLKQRHQGKRITSWGFEEHRRHEDLKDIDAGQEKISTTMNLSCELACWSRMVN